MDPIVKRGLRLVSKELDNQGILLAHDSRLPSVTGLLFESPAKGSWWSHPQGHIAFHVMEALDEEVAWTKLVNGKVTLVHQRLWPALVGAASSNGAWQLRKLPSDGKRLLQAVEGAGGPLRLDQWSWRGRRKPGAIAADLEKRLLIASHEIHTESGRHARVLQTWARWAAGAGVRPWSTPRSLAAIEQALSGWSPHPKLPWTP